MPLFYRVNDLPRVRVQLTQARFNVSHMRNIRISSHFTTQIHPSGLDSKFSLSSHPTLVFKNSLSLTTPRGGERERIFFCPSFLEREKRIKPLNGRGIRCGKSIFSLSLSLSPPLSGKISGERERIFYIATPAGPKLAKKSPAREIRAGWFGGLIFRRLGQRLWNRFDMLTDQIGNN